MNRQMIHANLQQLRQEVSTLTDSGLKNLQSEEFRQGIGTGQEVVDNSTYQHLRTLHIIHLQSCEKTIRQIDSALERLAEGTYGVCARCQEEINAERLKIIPFALFCTTCQEIVDTGNGLPGRRLGHTGRSSPGFRAA